MATRKPVPTLDDTARPDIDGGPLSGGASSLELDVAQLVRHPSNVRFEVALDEEMLESIRTTGVLQPLLVAPTPDASTYTVIDGNRRHLHAEQLAADGLTVKVPVHVRHDLVTAQQQREAMLITGLQRLDLTAAEESKAYEDAILEGLDVEAISRATGRRLSTIKSRLRLATLHDQAKTALHTGQISIGDAESMASFSDDPDATARLEEHLGTPNFPHALRLEEQGREVAKQTAASVKAAKKAGLAEATLGDGGWEWQTGPYPLTYLHGGQEDPAVHRAAGCLAFAVRGGRYYEVCTNPASHRGQTGETAEQVEKRAAEQSQWEQQQAEREKQRDAAIAAMQIRLEDLNVLLASVYTVKSLGPLGVAALRISIPNRLGTEFPEDAFRHLMESGDNTGRWGWSRTWLAEHWTGATDAFVVRTFIALTAADVDQVLAYSAEEDDVAGVHRRLAAWDWFVSTTGVELSDIDAALRTEAENDAQNVDDVPEAS